MVITPAVLDPVNRRCSRRAGLVFIGVQIDHPRPRRRCSHHHRVGRAQLARGRWRPWHSPASTGCICARRSRSVLMGRLGYPSSAPVTSPSSALPSSRLRLPADRGDRPGTSTTSAVNRGSAPATSADAEAPSRSPASPTWPAAYSSVSRCTGQRPRRWAAALLAVARAPPRHALVPARRLLPVPGLPRRHRHDRSGRSLGSHAHRDHTGDRCPHSALTAASAERPRPPPPARAIPGAPHQPPVAVIAGSLRGRRDCRRPQSPVELTHRRHTGCPGGAHHRGGPRRLSSARSSSSARLRRCWRNWHRRSGRLLVGVACRRLLRTPNDVVRHVACSLPSGPGPDRRVAEAGGGLPLTTTTDRAGHRTTPNGVPGRHRAPDAYATADNQGQQLSEVAGAWIIQLCYDTRY